MAVDEAPKLVAEKRIQSTKDKLTMYSLYKQVEEGDANEEERASMNKQKYFAWS